MAITYVGSNVASGSGGVGQFVVLPATIQNDMVLAIIGCLNRTSGTPSTSGYTEVASVLPVAPNNLRLYIAYKFMGATPDAGLTVDTSSAQTCVCVLVFRGVHTTTPLDVTATTLATGGPTNVNCPSITAINDNCCIVAAGTTSTADTTVGSISGYLPSPSVQVTTASATAAAVYRILSGGASVAEDPLAWSTWNTGNFALTATIALRPVTTSTDFNAVDKGTVTVTDKTVVGLETTPVSVATVTCTGKTVATPDGLVESIFVDPAMDIMLVGKAVDSTETFRAVTVTQAAVLYRGRTVTPREIQFEDIPRYAVKGRGSGHWMETR